MQWKGKARSFYCDFLLILVCVILFAEIILVILWVFLCDFVISYTGLTSICNPRQGHSNPVVHILHMNVMAKS